MQSPGGITNALDDFFKTVTQQTTDASDTTMRRQVSGSADTLMNFIRETADNLQTAQEGGQCTGEKHRGQDQFLCRPDCFPE